MEWEVYQNRARWVPSNLSNASPVALENLELCDIVQVDDLDFKVADVDASAHQLMSQEYSTYSDVTATWPPLGWTATQRMGILFAVVMKPTSSLVACLYLRTLLSALAAIQYWD